MVTRKQYSEDLLFNVIQVHSCFLLPFLQEAKVENLLLTKWWKSREIKSHEEMSGNCWQYSSGRKAQGVMLFLCMVICCISYKLCGP